MSYDVIKISTEEEILVKRLNKLIFINGVAIYNNSNYTHRKIYNKISNFNSWLEDYSTVHNLPFFEFRAIVKKFVDSIKENLSKNPFSNTSFDVPIEFYNDLSEIFNQDLSESNLYVALQNILWYYLSLENDVTLVKENGSFLMRDNYRDFNDIQINKEGLFRCNYQGIWFDPGCMPGKIITYSKCYIIDCKGNILHEEDYNKFISLLDSKNKSIEFLYQELTTIDNINETDELKEYLSKKKECNYILTHKEWRRADSWYITSYIQNENGIKMNLNDFIRGLKMLMNGENYLQGLYKYFISSQHSWDS